MFTEGKLFRNSSINLVHYILSDGIIFSIVQLFQISNLINIVYFFNFAIVPHFLIFFSASSTAELGVLDISGGSGSGYKSGGLR